jgi:hypothetical protein
VTRVVVPLTCPSCGAGLQIPNDITVVNCTFCSSSLAVEIAGGAAFARLREDVAAVRDFSERSASEAELLRLEERDLPDACEALVAAEELLAEAQWAVRDELGRSEQQVESRASLRIALPIVLGGVGGVVGLCLGGGVTGALGADSSPLAVVGGAAVFAIVLGVLPAVVAWLALAPHEADETGRRNLAARAAEAAEDRDLMAEEVVRLEERAIEVRVRLDPSGR